MSMVRKGGPNMLPYLFQSIKARTNIVEFSLLSLVRLINLWNVLLIYCNKVVQEIVALIFDWRNPSWKQKCWFKGKQKGKSTLFQYLFHSFEFRVWKYETIPLLLFQRLGCNPKSNQIKFVDIIQCCLLKSKVLGRGHSLTLVFCYRVFTLLTGLWHVEFPRKLWSRIEHKILEIKLSARLINRTYCPFIYVSIYTNWC